MIAHRVAGGIIKEKLLCPREVWGIFLNPALIAHGIGTEVK